MAALGYLTGGMFPEVEVLVLRKYSSPLYKPPLLLLVERLVVEVVEIPMLIRFKVLSQESFL